MRSPDANRRISLVSSCPTEEGLRHSTSASPALAILERGADSHWAQGATRAGLDGGSPGGVREASRGSPALAFQLVGSVGVEEDLFAPRAILWGHVRCAAAEGHGSRPDQLDPWCDLLTSRCEGRGQPVRHGHTRMRESAIPQLPPEGQTTTSRGRRYAPLAMPVTGRPCWANGPGVTGCRDGVVVRVEGEA